MERDAHFPSRLMLIVLSTSTQTTKKTRHVKEDVETRRVLDELEIGLVLNRELQQAMVPSKSKFLADVVSMILYGAATHKKLLSNFVACLVCRDQLQNFLLAR